MDNEMRPLTDEELMSEQATALPDKEVASVLDLNADLDLGINAAAPIDLAVAANANVAAPIDAAASANILSYGSDAQALSSQDAAIDQGITADANADSTQDSVIGQGDGAADTGTAGTTDGTTGTAPAPTSTGGLTDAAGALNGNLLNVDVNLDADAAIAAPINGAVAANANVAAPIDAAVAANIGSIDSQAYAISDQSATISQHIDGAANATAGQQSDLQQ
ncbi:peptidoglycan-binding protein [Pseudarthrobacter sp. NIBRBAC000502771]|uniref:peptidoglycan-binding protein n=1 Tax=Pseudarthrobacter sp. NIBRBAC000502771 TaxID=2590774 RepID=UPI0011328D35|nr:peptidoglycan-binding protein [Pseudarthrobacter sp. NIBRBAC000502771]QDG62586.1 peptidoglycan-binding protein [Pseudarthrobacter sp. NIBRBAC000502771]